MAASSPEVAQFSEDLPALVHEFSHFGLDVGATCLVLGAPHAVFLGPLTGLLFLGSNRLKFQVADVDLFLDADEVGLGTCVAFPARVHLLAQHPKSAFFVFALLSDVVEAFTAFSQVGL